MKIFIVAYMTFFENVMEMEQVEADSEFEALKNYMGGKNWELDADIDTVEKLKEFAFNCDSVIGAYELDIVSFQPYA